MHSTAVSICKDLNARLPLPRNKNELDEFLKVSPSWTHVDARNPNKTGNKAEWVDAENKPIGDRPVYTRVTNCKVTVNKITFLIPKADDLIPVIFALSMFISDLLESGERFIREHITKLLLMAHLGLLPQILLLLKFGLCMVIVPIKRYVCRK